ncbi:BLUF domain-containing protein [Woodsholea maritima]|uniref:BLUF domain-containing protein n=1 Tax=Woodsholea maritima TaxID=240237 RepID=UPI00035D5E7D|nr:BLUF domain-containing protein [Woodsholea maritima]
MSEYRYIYTSLAKDGFKDKDFKALVEHARRYNAARGISGAILLEQGRFFQILEGPRPAVMILLDKIKQDRRHSDMQYLHCDDEAERLYGDDGMVRLSLSLKDVGKPNGINNQTLEIIEHIISYDQELIAPILRPPLTALLSLLEADETAA